MGKKSWELTQQLAWSYCSQFCADFIDLITELLDCGNWFQITLNIWLFLKKNSTLKLWFISITILKSQELSYLNRISCVLLIFLPFLKEIESLQLAPIGVLYFQCLRQYIPGLIMAQGLGFVKNLFLWIYKNKGGEEFLTFFLA